MCEYCEQYESWPGKEFSKTEATLKYIHYD